MMMVINSCSKRTNVFNGRKRYRHKLTFFRSDLESSVKMDDFRYLGKSVSECNQ